MPELKDLIIDAELEEYMPTVGQMTDDALAQQLKETHGPKDAITVWLWQGKHIVVDGHRRVKMCKKLGLPIPSSKIHVMAFSSRDEAKNWMNRYALARRNLNTQELAIVAARLTESGSSVKEVAAVLGKSERTIIRYRNYADALKSLPEDIRYRVSPGGNIPATSDAVIAFANLNDEDRAHALQLIDNKTYSTLAQAMKIGDAPKSQEINEEDEDEFEDVNVDEDVDVDDPENDPDYDEPKGDTVSPKPGKVAASSVVKPPRKPALQVVLDAEATLGRLTRLLDEVNAALPNKTRHDSADYNLNAICKHLAAWKGEAE